MAGARHRSPVRKSHTSAGAVLAAALVGVAIVFGSVLALRSDRTSNSACSGGIALNVTTSASLSVPLEKAATDFNHQKQKVAGQCVTVKIGVRSSAGTIAALGLGWKNVTDAAVPDVWVPESSNWLGLARSTLPAIGRLIPATGTTIASSPVVIAMPRPLAQALDWPNTQLTWADLAKNAGSSSFWPSKGHKEFGPFKVGYANPVTSLSGLQAVLGLATSSQSDDVSDLSTATFLQNRAVQLEILRFERTAATVPDSEADLLAGLHKADSTGQADSYLSAFPIQESDLVAYNRGVGSPGGQPPKVQLAASYPKDGLFNEPIAYAVLGTASGNATRAQAAQAFLDTVRGSNGQAALRAAGFRDPSGANPDLTASQGTQPTLTKAAPVTVSGAVLKSAWSVFHAVHQRGTTLAVIDSSGSMKEIVPGNPPQTKIRIVLDAAVQGLELFAPNDMVGLWEFSTSQPNGVYRELSPTVPLYVKGRYGTHKDDITQAKSTVVPGGNTPLYKAALAAFRSQNSHYVADRLNEVVLLTDGKNDNPGDPNDLSLANLIKTIKAEYNPTKPVHIITIAYGADADPSALQQISNATHARSYRSENPHDVLNVFINAILEASEN